MESTNPTSAICIQVQEGATAWLGKYDHSLTVLRPLGVLGLASGDGLLQSHEALDEGFLNGGDLAFGHGNRSSGDSEDRQDSGEGELHFERLWSTWRREV